MILQKDPRLETVAYHEYGCYLFYIFFLANKVSNYMFTPGEMDKLYDVFVGHGWIDEDCYVLNASAIFNYLHVPLRQKMDCTWRPEDPHKYPPDYEPGDGEFAVTLSRYWNAKKKEWVYHFHGGRQGYDGYGLSRAAREGEVRSKRVFYLI